MRKRNGGNRMCGHGNEAGSSSEKLAGIANIRKMYVMLAVFVLLIAAVAAGCTYSGAAEAENKTDEPEVGVESPNVEAASAANAESLPAAYSFLIIDPDSGDVQTEIAAYQGELQDLYALYSELKTLAHLPVESDALPESERSYIIHFYASNGFTQNDVYTGFQMWEDGTFLIFDEDGSGNAAGVYESREYAARFIDILDEYHSEVWKAAFTEPEPLAESVQ